MFAEYLRRFLLLSFGLPILGAAAQAPASLPPQSHRLAFEIISIRPSKPDSPQSFAWATTPDGYHVHGQSIGMTLLMAYYPQGTAYWRDRLSGAPSWLMSDLYDIDAKVADVDLAAWQKQGVSLAAKPMLQQMLQSMLADRCHLTFHRVPGKLEGYALEVGKKGPHLTESKPDEELPKGYKFPSGGVMVGSGRGEPYHAAYHRATMADLAGMLSLNSMGRPVLDHTGLTGQYDFEMKWIGDPDHPERDGVIEFNDQNPLSHYNVEALGLRIVPVQIPIDNMVIDHIEKPSEN